MPLNDGDLPGHSAKIDTILSHNCQKHTPLRVLISNIPSFISPQLSRIGSVFRTMKQKNPASTLGFPYPCHFRIVKRRGSTSCGRTRVLHNIHNVFHNCLQEAFQDHYDYTDGRCKCRKLAEEAGAARRCGWQRMLLSLISCRMEHSNLQVLLVPNSSSHNSALRLLLRIAYKLSSATWPDPLTETFISAAMAP